MINQSNNLITISEYGLIGKDNNGKNANSFKHAIVPLIVYQELEEFAKTEHGKDVLGFSTNGKYLQAKNYVGTIQTKSGYTLEILPKIYKSDEDEFQSKKIFLELLKLLYNLPNYKHVNSANFKNEKMPLLEIFITMFLTEVGNMIKKGIKSDYIDKEDNLYFLKGKLLISQQLKKNYIHKERFFVEYDEYSQNRAENRLVKATLKYLSKVSKSHENIRLIRFYQEIMFSIDYSLNYDIDFRACKIEDRGMNHYKTLLIWAKIFLKKETFSSFSGKSIAFAILYPMEKLFENYVEHYLKNRYRRFKDIMIKSQVTGKYFVEKLFMVRPDFVISKNSDICIVADAKWKLLSKDHSFSQSDFYQLFAYSKIYQINRLRLYYPKSEFFNKANIYTYFDKTRIKVIPLDMNDIVKENQS